MPDKGQPKKIRKTNQNPLPKKEQLKTQSSPINNPRKFLL